MDIVELLKLLKMTGKLFRKCSLENYAIATLVLR